MAGRPPVRKKARKEGSDRYDKRPVKPFSMGPAVGRKLTDGKYEWLGQPDHENTQRQKRDERGLYDDMERASCGMYHKSKKYGGAVMKKRGGVFKGTF